MTAAVTIDCDNRAVVTLASATDAPKGPANDALSRSTAPYLDSATGEAKSTPESPVSAPEPRDHRRRPTLAPDVALADLAKLPAHLRCSRVSITGAAGVTLDAVRSVMRDLATGLAFTEGRRGKVGGGAWLAVDVRDDGTPHIYGIATYETGALQPLLRRACESLGADLAGQKIDAITGWERYAELGDPSDLRTNLGKAFAYGAKPWPHGQRDLSLDFVATGVFAGLPIASQSTLTAPSVTTTCKGPDCSAILPASRGPIPRETCSAKCRQRLSRLNRAQANRDAAVCSDCFLSRSDCECDKATNANGAKSTTKKRPAVDRGWTEKALQPADAPTADPTGGSSPAANVDRNAPRTIGAALMARVSRLNRTQAKRDSTDDSTNHTFQSGSEGAAGATRPAPGDERPEPTSGEVAS